MKEQRILRGGNLPTVCAAVTKVIVDLVHVAEHKILLFV